MGINNAATPATTGLIPLKADIILPIPNDTTAKTAAIIIDEKAWNNPIGLTFAKKNEDFIIA